MRLIFFLFAAAAVMAWYAWAIRPVKREQSNMLLTLGVLRLV